MLLVGELWPSILSDPSDIMLLQQQFFENESKSCIADHTRSGVTGKTGTSCCLYVVKYIHHPVNKIKIL